MQIGLDIRQERLKKKLEQQHLAEAACISKTLLVSIEQGRGNPTIDTLSRLAVALDMELVISLQAKKSPAKKP